MGERQERMLLAVISRAGQRADDLLQEAWLAHLAGQDPVRRVWRIDRADRRRAARERLLPDADLPTTIIREKW